MAQLRPFRMFPDLAKIFTCISRDSNIRAVLLTGAGERGFMAGIDIGVSCHL